MIKRKTYLICLVSAAVIVCMAVFALFWGVSERQKAVPLLREEIDALALGTESAENENKQLLAELDEVNTELSSKDTVNSYYMEYKKTHDDLTIEIEDLKKQSASLDAEIAEVRKKSGGIEGLIDGKKGKTYTLSPNEVYACPSKIPSGRYTASGSGNFTVLTSSGSARISQNLDVAYGHAYTFNLADTEKIKVTGSVTLTEIK